MNNLKIKEIPSNKTKIKNPPLAEQDVIPKLGTSCIFNGTTGMGKSTLLTNLISDKRFYGKPGVFTHKFLVSPTAEGDDVQKKLGIKKKNTFTNLNIAHHFIEKIMMFQKQKVIKHGSDKAPQILLIYDDVIAAPKFMRTDEFVKSFIASRHYNLTTMICTQSWTAVPRRCRLQARNIFFFAAPQSEVEILCDEHCPPRFTKKQFVAMVNWATHKPYNFLYINKTVPMKERYRRNLDEIIDLKKFRQSTRKPTNQAYENHLDSILEQSSEEEEKNVKTSENNEHKRKRRVRRKHGINKKSFGRRSRRGPRGIRQYSDVYGGPPFKKTKADYEKQIAESI